MIRVRVQDEHKMRMSSRLGQRSELPYVMIRGIKVVNKGDGHAKHTTTGIGLQMMLDITTSGDRRSWRTKGFLFHFTIVILQNPSIN
jgi:hypothetical protein